MISVIGIFLSHDVMYISDGLSKFNVGILDISYFIIIKLIQSRHFLFKCLYQAMKVICMLGVSILPSLRFFDWILDCNDSVVYFVFRLSVICVCLRTMVSNKGNNKIIELRTILQRESQNS